MSQPRKQHSHGKAEMIKIEMFCWGLIV